MTKTNEETAKVLNAAPCSETGIVAALAAAQAEMRTVCKDAANPYFKSNYATLKAIVEMLRPILARHGLCFIQGVEKVDGEKWMVTRIYHEGEPLPLSSAVPFACADGKPQGVGSAITYMKRYGLQCAFGVVVAEDETDDDGNRANGNRQQPKPSAPKEDIDF